MSLQIKKVGDYIPEGMTLGYLEVVIMPNGELIHMGNTVGTFAESKSFLCVPEESK